MLLLHSVRLDAFQGGQQHMATVLLGLCPPQKIINNVYRLNTVPYLRQVSIVFHLIFEVIIG